MKFIKAVSLSGALLLSSQLFAAKPPPGFTMLFNGLNLAGWRGGVTFDHRQLMELPEAERESKIAEWTAGLTKRNDQTGKPHWRVENGELVTDGIGPFATSIMDYGNFELLVDYKIPALADSGIYLRGVPQVQIWDRNQPDPRGNGNKRGSGGLWNNREGSPGRYPLVVADNPVGEWNHIRILMVGERVTIWLNEKLVVNHAVLENYFDRKLPIEKQRPIIDRGPIQLQTHGPEAGEIHWRDIFIREIGAEESREILEQWAKDRGQA